ncbi:amidohydrolase family protein [Pelotomaculum isophthalicicum JI]|uniref:Amidohydrolase family protein n=1 Tax=Pelotomaculum isophthalicicum JI TaxID=947010 RepID=A0A9X4JV44_9FIRM|nr:amidohydrolase family protein [Pelotomaculum isophthalicicum]MDF9406853.1 amidohydrolase family protein [Pelotomaculum isophthalicicum JI]
MKLSVPVIDFHIHPAYYEKYCPSAEEFIKKNQHVEDWTNFTKKYKDPADFLRYLDDNVVDYAVILAELSPITTGICTNEYVHEFCLGQDRLIPFACVNPYLINDPGREVERLVKEMGFRGLKLYPTYNYFYPNEPLVYPIYAKAEELGIPVMLHTGSSVFKGARIKYGDPLFFDDVAIDFPDLNLLMTHCGRGLWYNTAYFLSRLHKNLYMEVTGLPPQKLLDYFPELERNADKVIFGSDWPAVASIKSNIDAVRALPLKEETKEKILGGNAARLLKMT